MFGVSKCARSRRRRMSARVWLVHAGASPARLAPLLRSAEPMLDIRDAVDREFTAGVGTEEAEPSKSATDVDRDDSTAPLA